METEIYPENRLRISLKVMRGCTWENLSSLLWFHVCGQSDIIAPWLWNAYREEHWALHIYLTHPNYILCLNWNDYSTLEGIFWGTDAIKIHNIGLSGEWEYHISYYATALDWIQRHRCTAEANISTQLNTFRNLNYICLLYTHRNLLTP